MVRQLRLIALLAALALCVGAANKWSSKADASGRYRFYNSEAGQFVQLKGISMTGLETGTRGTNAGGGYWLFDSGTSSTAPTILNNLMLTLIKSWNSTVVRIPICGSGYLQNYSVRGWDNKEIAGYRDWLDNAVKTITDNGAVAIIDLHLWALAKETSIVRNEGMEDGSTGINKVSGTDSTATADWYGEYYSARTGKTYNTGHSRSSWQCAIANADGCTIDNLARNNNIEHFKNLWYEIANRYKDNNDVWFELFNEPYIRKSAEYASTGCSMNGPGTAYSCPSGVGFGDTPDETTWNWTLWSNIMYEGVKVIRDAGAPNIIMIGGLDWAYDFLGKGGSVTGGPIDRPSLLQWNNDAKYSQDIVYVMHPYQHGACCGAIGKTSDESATDPYESGFCLFAPTDYSPSKSVLPLDTSIVTAGSFMCDTVGYARTQNKKSPPCIWKSTAYGPTGSLGVCAGDTDHCQNLTKAQCDAVDWSLPSAGGWSKYVLPMSKYGAIFASEFGTFDCSSAYTAAFLEWARKFGVSYTAWALWPQNSGGPGAGACGYPTIMMPRGGAISASDCFGKGTNNCLTYAGCKADLVPMPWSGKLIVADIALNATSKSNPCTMTKSDYATGWNTCSSSVEDMVYCNLTCTTGYQAVGGTCNNGVWDTMPTCIPKPCSVTKPSAGVSGWGSCSSSVASSSSCSFACSAGYSSNLGTCSKGSWDQVPTCTPNNCTVSKPEGASSWGTCTPSVKSGSYCQFSCSSGYNGVQGTCTNGAWSITPTCSANPCSLYSTATGATSWGNCSSTLQSGEICSFDCASGYTVQVGKCLAGSWLSTASCVAANCTLSLPEGAASWGSCTTVVRDGQNCAFSCNSGYTANSGTCNSGTWSVTPTCTTKTGSSCTLSLPSTATSWSGCSSSVSSGSSCSYGCSSGYEATTGICNNGVWSPEPTCTAYLCELSLPAGASSFGSCAAEVAANAKCSLVCESGYTNNTGSCNNQGSWQTMPACTPNSCKISSLPTNANGYGNCNSPVSSGATCSASCNNGYSPKVGRCLLGAWVEPLGCTSIAGYCSLSLPTGATGYGTCTATVNASTSCSVECSSAYTAVAGTCNSDGGWTSTPSCAAKSGSSCTLTQDGHASDWGTCSASVASGSSCSFECSSGYSSVSGACSDGTWVSKPYCLASVGSDAASIYVPVQSSLSIPTKTSDDQKASEVAIAAHFSIATATLISFIYLLL